jgi:amino acid transporter
MTLIGPQAALAGVLAGIVLGLTLLSVRELLGGSGERGGTYILIQETLGGWGAFIAGWSILSGCIALSAALAQATAGHFVLLFPSIQVPSTAIALAIFAILVLVQLFQVLPRRTLLWPVVVILLIALAVIVLTVLPRVSPRVYRTTPASDLRDLMRSTAWLAASYAALEAILASRRQIRDPGHHLSPAMLGVLLVGSLVFAAITLVGAGLSSPAAPVEATLASILSAASPLPPWIVGALAVAVMSLATSGCLMTAARQMHCLSREGGLPRGLRRPQRPFPMPPLLFGVLTAVTGLLIVLAPARLLTDLAAGTFLLAMILLNVAAIHSHRTEPERRRLFVVPFYPQLLGRECLSSAWSGGGRGEKERIAFWCLSGAERSATCSSAWRQPWLVSSTAKSFPCRLSLCRTRWPLKKAGASPKSAIYCSNGPLAWPRMLG